MLTKCPECEKVQEVPDVYKLKEIKCKFCDENFTASIYKPDQKSTIPIIIFSLLVVIIIGVLASLFAYKKGHEKGKADGFMEGIVNVGWLSEALQENPVTKQSLLQRKKTNITPLQSSGYIFPQDKTLTIDKAKSKLAKHNLLFISERVVTFEDKSCIEYFFAPGFSRTVPALVIYADKKGFVFCMSAYWMGSRTGFPTKTQEFSSFYLNEVRQLFDAFKEFTNISLYNVPENFQFIDNDGWDVLKKYTYDKEGFLRILRLNVPKSDIYLFFGIFVYM